MSQLFHEYPLRAGRVVVHGRKARRDASTLLEQQRIVTSVTELRRLCADLRQRLAAQQTAQSQLADTLVEQALA